MLKCIFSEAVYLNHFSIQNNLRMPNLLYLKSHSIWKKEQLPLVPSPSLSPFWTPLPYSSTNHPSAPYY